MIFRKSGGSARFSTLLDDQSGTRILSRQGGVRIEERNMANDFDIKDPDLAEQGYKRIDWAWQKMPVLRELAERFSKERPLQGIRISGCLNITTETANLARCLKAAGADIQTR